MDEPRYVDPDDPFEDRQALRDKKNLTGVRDLELLSKIRQATGRKPDNDFAKPAEKNKYLKMEGQYLKGQIPVGWIAHILEWPKKENKGRIKIMFPAVLSAILNKARMQDWIGKQPINKVSMEKYSDPDAFD